MGEINPVLNYEFWVLGSECPSSKIAELKTHNSKLLSESRFSCQSRVSRAKFVTVARWAHKAAHAHRNKSGPGGTACSHEAVQASVLATPTP